MCSWPGSQSSSLSWSFSTPTSSAYASADHCSIDSATTVTPACCQIDEAISMSPGTTSSSANGLCPVASVTIRTRMATVTGIARGPGSSRQSRSEDPDQVEILGAFAAARVPHADPVCGLKGVAQQLQHAERRHGIGVEGAVHLMDDVGGVVGNPEDHLRIADAVDGDRTDRAVHKL